MSFSRTIEAFCGTHNGIVEVTFDIDGEHDNREGLRSVANTVESFLTHATNQNLVPQLKMLLDCFEGDDSDFESNVFVSGQAVVDSNSIGLGIRFRASIRMTSLQKQKVKAYIATYFLRKAFEKFADTIGEMIFEGSLHVYEDEHELITV